MDAAGAANVVKMPSFRAMETEYAKLVRSIKFPSADSFGDSKAPEKGPENEGGDEAEDQDIC
ncbi:unnamed protein product [Dibothriocephalus latus]|uniref:Uncharacterized protein n=1 Tax=Dibothriocephalus latus TaxID=60516 RepID=A0A3P7MND1_DIBLA|nr:unnamed protein product [Dibothriocephalus latus]